MIYIFTVIIVGLWVGELVLYKLPFVWALTDRRTSTTALTALNDVIRKTGGEWMDGWGSVMWSVCGVSKDVIDKRIEDCGAGRFLVHMLS